MDEIGPSEKEGPPGFTTAEKVALGLVVAVVAVGLWVLGWLNSLSGQGHPL